MQTRKHRLYCLIILFCLLTSCFCFDNSVSTRMESLSNANQSPLFSNSASLTANDICTMEMLRNTYPTLQSLQSSKPVNSVHFKNGLQYAIAGLPYVLSQATCFFTSGNVTVCIENTKVAEIIHYIHNTDGKK